jgi:phosphoribosyl-ATP pyrophosphohydrolase
MTPLEHLEQTLLARQKSLKNPENQSNPSYVHKLYAKGVDGIAKKVAEEMAEFILASKTYELKSDTATQENVIYEAADLLFHTMVLLQHQNISFQEVVSELARREGVSGLVEKANRGEVE